MNTLNCSPSALINYTKTPALGPINELGLKGSQKMKNQAMF